MLTGGQSRSEPRISVTVRHAGNGVGLDPVPARAGQAGDLARVVQERVRVLDVGLEPELVDDVRIGVHVVVDHELIQHVVAELVEVRAAGRSLERDVVHDQGDGVRLVRADEGVRIGVVGDRILRDRRRLAMGRHRLGLLPGRSRALEEAGNKLGIVVRHLGGADEKQDIAGRGVRDVGDHILPNRAEVEVRRDLLADCWRPPGQPRRSGPAGRRSRSWPRHRRRLPLRRDS